eukprot:scaffold286870_cov30-Tisochrysis_lutea.AAC.2
MTSNSFFSVAIPKATAPASEASDATGSARELVANNGDSDSRRLGALDALWGMHPGSHERSSCGTSRECWGSAPPMDTILRTAESCRVTNLVQLYLSIGVVPSSCPELRCNKSSPTADGGAADAHSSHAEYPRTVGQRYTPHKRVAKR